MDPAAPPPHQPAPASSAPQTPPAAELPEDLRDILRHLDASERDAETLIADLSQAQITWQPSPTAWGIGQCLDHLSTTTRVYLPPMQAAVAAARRRGTPRRGPIRPGPLASWFLRTLEPPPRRKLRAPGKIVPALGKSKAQLDEELHVEQQKLRQFLHDVADLDLNRIRFVNPFIPLLRFSVGTGLLILATHQRRHLWQAAGVRRDPAFP